MARSRRLPAEQGGERGPLRGTHQRPHRVCQELAPPNCPPREAGEDSQPKPDRRRAEPTLGDVVLVGPDEIGGETGDGERRSRVGLNEVKKVSEAPAVGRESSGPALALDREVRGEPFEERREMRWSPTAGNCAGTSTRRNEPGVGHGSLQVG
jgi:hypothetical protein